MLYRNIEDKILHDECSIMNLLWLGRRLLRWSVTIRNKEPRKDVAQHQLTGRV